MPEHIFAVAILAEVRCPEAEPNGLAAAEEAFENHSTDAVGWAAGSLARGADDPRRRIRIPARAVAAVKYGFAAAAAIEQQFIAREVIRPLEIFTARRSNLWLCADPLFKNDFRNE
jgi:hypothetical protein